MIANLGDVNVDGVKRLREQAATARAGGDSARADFLEFSAVQFENSEIFDRPNREYNAVVLKADKRFSRSFFMTGSYTFSNLRGNFPGLFSPETGQLDPNLTSMYDLPDLMGNRFGNLAADRPHLVTASGSKPSSTSSTCLINNQKQPSMRTTPLTTRTRSSAATRRI